MCDFVLERASQPPCQSFFYFIPGLVFVEVAAAGAWWGGGGGNLILRRCRQFKDGLKFPCSECYVRSKSQPHLVGTVRRSLNGMVVSSSHN